MISSSTGDSRSARPRLKRLADQVMVLTGATSGIGLATARQAARRGTSLMLVARNEEALRRLADELAADGARVVWAVADVADEEAVKSVAERAVAELGGIDTWVNNAGVSIYGRIAEVLMEDQRRLFDTNVWGVVHGARAAAEHMSDGGAIINIGSVLSDRAIPLQGTYSASKHAVKGFTDALRMELENEGRPISVTLIKPSAIDTPYRRHAKNYMLVEPKNPAPVYDPELVARAILHAAEHPVRDLTVGGGGRMISVLGSVAPRLTDRVMEWTMFSGQRTSRAATHDEESLYGPTESGGLRERGGYEGRVRRDSVHDLVTQHPVASTLAALAVGVLIGGGVWAASSPERRGHIRDVGTGLARHSRDAVRRLRHW
jgi:short-subunit dehydrogenase